MVLDTLFYKQPIKSGMLPLWSWFYFAIGLTVSGIFGSFSYYLPELFPTRLRGTGAGFCYNAGRSIAAIGPFIVGGVASRSANPLQAALQLLFLVGFIPLLGILAMPLIIETKNKKLIQ
jgi:MFS family permease